jgi:hypothetical protein
VRRLVILALVVIALVGLTETFHVARGQNPEFPKPELLYSLSPDRSDPLPLTWANLSGEVYIFASDVGQHRTRFFLDWTLVQEENSVPWDFAGGSVGEARPFGTTTLPQGIHTISAISSFDFGTSTASTIFTVDNRVCEMETIVVRYIDGVEQRRDSVRGVVDC